MAYNIRDARWGDLEGIFGMLSFIPQLRKDGLILKITPDNPVIDHSDGSMTYDMNYRFYLLSNTREAHSVPPELNPDLSLNVPHSFQVENIEREQSALERNVRSLEDIFNRASPVRFKKVNGHYQITSPILDNQDLLPSEIKEQRTRLFETLPNYFDIYEVKDTLAPLLGVEPNRVLEYIYRRIGEHADLSSHSMHINEVVALFTSLRADHKRPKIFVYAAMLYMYRVESVSK